jgi:catechol 2,3-dioxygenase-like lactoylglutathione lyase family enzyme
VKDIRRALDFYSGILEMKIDWRPDPGNVYLTTGSDNLALHEAGNLTPAPEQTAGNLDHFGFFVDRPEDVDEWARRLESRGIPLVQQPKTHRDGARSIYFRDPDGNLIQLLHHPRLK